MRREVLVFWLAVSVAACGGGKGGSFVEPPPSPGLTEEEALRQAAERSRQERDIERGISPQDIPAPVVREAPPPARGEVQPVTSARPLNAEETRILHDALAVCTQNPTRVEVWVEPGGLPFLAPGQRFPESDLECFARQVGSVRLPPERQRRGVVTLP